MKQREWPDVRFPDSSKFHIDRLTFQVTLVDRILVNQISGILGSTDMWALTALDRARRRLVLLGRDVACSGLCRGLAVVHYSHHMKKHTRKKTTKPSACRLQALQLTCKDFLLALCDDLSKMMWRIV